MNEQLPAEVDGDEEIDHAEAEAACRKMVNKLVTMVQAYSGDRTRMRNLVLFEERVQGKITRPMSTVLPYDRPETELLLYHRDQVRKLQRKEDRLNEQFDNLMEDESFKPEYLAECLGHMTKMEAQRLKHLEMIENLCANQTKEFGGKESLTAKMVSDASTLAQKMTEHKDKMELANKAAKTPTSNELKQRLAQKYNISVAEVEQMLASKAADVQSID